PPQPAPLQPVKSEPAAALALRVTVLPPGKVAVQLPGQVMPAGALVTLPPPVPAKFTCRVPDGTTRLNVAVTMTEEAFRVTVQGPAPLQPPPLQPAKTVPAAALALRVTVLPPGKVAVQLPRQVMPAGALGKPRAP